MVIQTKAKSLLDDIKSKAVSNDNASGSNTDKNETFEPSQGRFERFKVWANLHSIALKGEAACANITAAERYPTELKALIHEGGYDLKQVFNVDETGLFWKRLPNRTFISKTEKSAPGFKASKDRLTLLLRRSIEISEEQNLTSKQISKAMCLIAEAMEIFFKKRSWQRKEF